ITAELNMDEFVLTGLESEIEDAQYQDIKMLVAKLGETLRTISDNDEKSQLLMKQGLRPVLRQNPRVKNEHASNAYKQAMKQTVPKTEG
ncbi:MAG: hypothetical protein PHE26_12570, partial [Syntrophomonadaceae bacterium]|nr:hypothetical protein [Syntrophomonadaceae bacterium]